MTGDMFYAVCCGLWWWRKLYSKLYVMWYHLDRTLITYFVLKLARSPPSLNKQRCWDLLQLTVDDIWLEFAQLSLINVCDISRRRYTYQIKSEFTYCIAPQSTAFKYITLESWHFTMYQRCMYQRWHVRHQNALHFPDVKSFFWVHTERHTRFRWRVVSCMLCVVDCDDITNCIQDCMLCGILSTGR